METMVKSATEALSEIKAHAEMAKQETRDCTCMKPGCAVRQGDIYIHRVKENHAHGKEVEVRQLAEGNTMNSRHIAESPARVFEGTTAPEGCSAGILLGPCVESDKPFTVSHPEHAHVNLGAGIYQITHQMDARTLQRIRD